MGISCVWTWHVQVLFLKTCADDLSNPLLYLLCRSFNEGIISQYCAIHVHKSGRRKCISNYRHVSPIPLVSKVFEKIQSNRLLNPVQPDITEQPQFSLRGRNCSTNLTALLREPYHAFKRPQLVMVYTDFSKALDQVSHKFLLHKLACYNVYPCHVIYLEGSIEW